MYMHMETSDVDCSLSSKRKLHVMLCRVDPYFGGCFFLATDTPYLAFGSLYFCGTENTHDCRTKQYQRF